MTITKNKRFLALTFLMGFCILFYLLYGMTFKNYQHLLSLRVPRLLGMIIAAIAITSSTLVFQAIACNDILTPDILGYSQLYALIQTALVIFLSATNIFVFKPILNFLIVLVIMLIVTSIIYPYILEKLRNNFLLLLLVGSVLSTLFQSANSYFDLLIDPNEFSILQNKMIASLTSMNLEVILIAAIVMAGALVWLVRNIYALEVMNLGRDYATNLGIPVKKFQREALLFVSIMISVSTALIGPLTFLGLIAVNSARLITKTYKQKNILILAVFNSLILLVGGQIIIERFLKYSVSLGTILNFVGGIYVIYWILKEHQ